MSRLLDRLSNGGHISSAMHLELERTLDATGCAERRPFDGLVGAAFLRAGEDLPGDAALKIIGDANRLGYATQSGRCP
jgi:hypothetical protein